MMTMTFNEMIVYFNIVFIVKLQSFSIHYRNLRMQKLLLLRFFLIIPTWRQQNFCLLLHKSWNRDAGAPGLMTFIRTSEKNISTLLQLIQKKARKEMSLKSTVMTGSAISSWVINLIKFCVFHEVGA